MSQSLRQERHGYAARSQNSDIFNSEQKPDTQRPGRKFTQGHADNDIFDHSVQEEDSVLRSKPKPAPFLTDNNAVNNHGRMGGYVEHSDSPVIPETEKGGRQVHYEDDTPTAEQIEDDQNTENERNQVKYNENTTTAQNHKSRQMTSHIFDTPPAAHAHDASKPAYNRNHMSNVF